jgi:DNA-binding response OmpR family regulator
MKKSVLIVEQDESLAEVMKLILTEAGYPARCCGLKRMEFEIAQFRPAVILLDHWLIQKLTYCMVEKIRQCRYGAKAAILLTTTVCHLDACSEHDGVLYKPFNVRDLVDLVASTSPFPGKHTSNVRARSISH